MSMLAAPRRKQKWTLNPRGKHWSEDSNKFGQKMLEKMGWSSGKGLGPKGQGMVEHIRVRVKNDQLGIGFTKDKDDQWTEHQDDFNSFLQNLQKEQATEIPEAAEEKNKVLSGKSLEEKSKQSQKRVHYKKFTRGKDVNKYSAKDLANIFGKKDLNEKPKEEEVEEDSKVYDPVGTKDTTAGIITFKGGNMNEYFNKKLVNSDINNASAVNVNSDSETECRTGFGFSPVKSKSKFYINNDNDIKEEQSDSQTEKYKGFGFLKSSETKATNKKLSNLDYVFDNPCLDLNISDNSLPIKKEPNYEEYETTDKVTPKKRKSACFNESEEADSSDKPKLKKQKNEFTYINEGLDLNYPESTVEVKKETDISPDNSKSLFKKSKKEKKTKEITEQYTPLDDSQFANESELKIKKEVSEELPNDIKNSALNSEFSDSPRLKKSKKKNKNLEIISNGIENPALDLEAADRQVPKKNKRKINEIEVVPLGIENPGLDLECPDRPTPKKNKKIDLSNGIENPALDLNCPDRPTPKKSKKNSEVEHFTSGIENPGLDLECPDRPTPKKNKKIDFSSGIENPALDLNCPDRQTPKKSKKNSEVELCANGIENPGLDLEYSENLKSNDFEIPSKHGLENNALDLTDENSCKRRVTFNDEVEYSTDTVSKKKKKKKKLDKYEVTNENISKKKVEEPAAFVNEGLDLEIIYEEEVDNEINERKSKKCKRKKEKKISHLETIEEAPEEESPNQSLSENNKENKDFEIVAEFLCDDVQEISSDDTAKKNDKKKERKKLKDIKTDKIDESEEKEIEQIDLTKEKIKKKKKKDKPEVVVEEEASKVDISKTEISSGEISDTKEVNMKKKHKKVKDSSEEIISLQEFLNEKPSQNESPNVDNKMQVNKTVGRNNFQRTNSFKKPKQIMKSLFLKNPTLMFNGANINEIKGYGSHLYNNSYS